MKKALILTSDFPPYVSVGALRPFSWYKYFKQNGVLPIVVTRSWNSTNPNSYIAASIHPHTEIKTTEYGVVIEAPFKPHLGNKLLLKYGENRFRLLRKILTSFYELGQFVFPIGNKRSIYLEARKYLKNNAVDVIIATGEPFVLLYYASRLSRKTKTPYIVDFRDSWSFSKSRSKNKWLKKWNLFWEKQSIKHASKITTVSEFLTTKIAEKNQTKFEIIENGFNKELIDKVKDTQQNNKVLSIALSGSIYPHHPITSIFREINRFISITDNPQLHINFFGVNTAENLQKQIRTQFPKLANYVSFHNKMSNERVLTEFAKQNLFILFNAYATTGTKIYEYVALNRKILLCYSNDLEANVLFKKHYSLKIPSGVNDHLQADILKETNSGIFVKDSNHFFQLICEYYKEFSNTGLVYSNSSNYLQYSREKQAQKMVEVTNKVINQHH